MSAEPTKKQGSGKGGNFATRKNPFDRPAVAERAPIDKSKVLLQAIEVCLKAGCAVMLGQTRDGGATVITILDGDDRHRTYCSTATDLEAAAQALVEMYM